MELYEEICQEHLALLHSKGYTEDKLNSMRPLGSGEKELRNEAAACYIDAVFTPDPSYFILKFDGLFNNKQDKADFHLLFAYDPARASLEIKQLEVFYKEYFDKITFNNSYELPTPTEALNRLLQKVELTRQRNMNLKVVKPKKSKGKGL